MLAERMKYVIVNHMAGEVPIIFSQLLDHAAVVPQNHTAVSAGSVEFGVDGDGPEYSNPRVDVNCFGFSKTLNLKSRGMVDTEIIRAEIERASW